ncbi:MAG: 3-isopropylmalate dehydratase small subunit [Clostridia bacterium]|jgi:3-isopropylmalate/(R)-2-methylmalate dehydratase small subunit|nr:3-isopropylmalate dehydratase small subunit [Clostridia bacterium]
MAGKAFVFSDNIDTDLMVPGKYLTLSKPEELAKVCMAGIAENFAAQISPGDVFVAGSNFGCGSSREHAPISIKAAGVNCVIAASFARIFYRNSINIGLPVLESPAAVKSIGEGDEISVDFENGQIFNHTKSQTYAFKPFPEYILEIFKAGGLVSYIKNQANLGGN